MSGRLAGRGIAGLTGLSDELSTELLLIDLFASGLLATDELSIGLREAGVEFSHLLALSAAMAAVMFVFIVGFIPFCRFEFMFTRFSALFAVFSTVFDGFSAMLSFKVFPISKFTPFNLF